MSETNCQVEAKLKDMQKYVPFLERVIAKLRICTGDQKDNPRRAQLKKMELLHELLTAKGDKLKMETLLKCEGVLIKLHSKIEKNDTETSRSSNNANTTQDSSVEVIDITGPESPPPQPVEEVQPVEIPTERRTSPIIMAGYTRRDSKSKERTHRHSKDEFRKSERGSSGKHQKHDRTGSHHKTNERVEYPPEGRQPHTSQHDNMKLSRDESALFVRRPASSKNTHSNDAYSPEECWDEFEETDKCPRSASSLLKNCLNSSEAEADHSYRDTIFNLKKQPATFDKRGVHSSTPKECFKAAGSTPYLPHSTPVKAPTIPEILKSPPLSANDISDLLNESMESSNIPSVSEVGSRRPVAENTGNVTANAKGSNLDMVRKKFAMIARSSPPTISSPEQPIPTVITQSNTSSVPNERIALKYNPHPRSERETLTSPGNVESRVHTVTKPSDPRLNSPAVTIAKPQDPRLRKSTPSQLTQESRGRTTSPLLPTPSLPRNVPPMGVNPLLIGSTVGSLRNYPPTSYNYDGGVPYNHPQNYAHLNRQKFPNSSSPYVDPRKMHHGSSSDFMPQNIRHQAHVETLNPLTYRRNWTSGAQAPQTNYTNSLTVNLATQKKPSTTNCSPEENWDSDHEDEQTQIISRNPHTKSSTLSSAASGCESRSYCNQQYGPAPVSQGQQRFSAVLNDKTERIKYFESKKQKHQEPHTYAEYKQLKARAAAEASAKQKISETATQSTVKSASELVLGKSDKDDPPKKDNSAPASKEPALDTLYRNTNFSNCDFPKAKTSFKIPKKQPSVEDAKSSAGIPLDKTHKGDSQCVETDTKVSKKRDEVVTATEKDKSESLNKKTKEEKPSSGLKSSENKKDEKQNAKKSNNNKINKSSEKKSEPHSSTKEKKGGDVKKSKEKHVTSENIDSSKANKQAATPLSSKNKSNKLESQEHKTGAVSNKSDKSKIDNSECTKSEVSQTREENLLPTENKVEAAEKHIESKQDNDVILPSTEIPQITMAKPARILKRRNTMFVQGSEPLVDKEKIFSTKALVFEDIHSKEGKQSDINAIKLNRKNKVLAEIFQKTDDNCTVSTQNIISGKRRTRTTVNFNEVQRSLEIFQMKKRESKKDLDPEAVPKKPTKKSPTSKSATQMEKVEPVKVESEKCKISPVEDESQNCAVSSTTLHAEGESTDTDIPINKQKQISDETEEAQPSSSTVNSMSATSTTDDDKKAEILEGFVQDILKPNANTEYIFSLLRQILSDDKLKLVKEIVDSAAKQNARQDDECEAETITKNDKEVAKDDGKSKGTHEVDLLNDDPNKKAARKRKRNELDRLNEDIRDMFISKGVLTATGRRMCTLVAAERAQTSESQREEGMAIEKEIKNAKSLSTMRKSKVVIGQADISACEKQVSKQTNVVTRRPKEKEVESLDSDYEESILNDSEMGSTETSMEESIHSTLEETPPRGMPVLKPHTPIKQSEVEDSMPDSNSKQPAGVKSKLKIILPKLKIRQGRKSLRNSESQKDVTENHKSGESGSSNDQTSKQVGIKNIHMEWHSQSEYAKCCVVCNLKTNYMGPHYKQQHDENYTSRLAPKILEDYKQCPDKSKALFGVMQKKYTLWFYRCPFCLQYYRTMLTSWLEHFNIHTGEYYFECSRCHRPSNKQKPLELHIKSQCVGAKIDRNGTPTMTTCVKAHVCHLCNFLQINKPNLVKHYVQQHDMESSEAQDLGYTINLLDMRDIKIVDNQTAIELESDHIEKATFSTNISNEQVSERVDSVEKSKIPSCESNDDGTENVTSTSGNLNVMEKQKSNDSKNTDLSSNANIFIATREENDSPTMDNITQNLLTIESEELENRNVNTLSNVSIAERLSQRLRNLKEKSVASNNEEGRGVSISESEHIQLQAATAEPNNCRDDRDEQEAVEAQCAQSEFNKSNESEGCLVIVENEMDVSVETTEDCEDTGDDSVVGDDDDKWEDIEVTESAPSTSSVLSTTSSASKVVKEKNKTVFQKFNRLYASNNKLKKSLSISKSIKKKTVDKPDIQTAPKPVALDVIDNSKAASIQMENDNCEPHLPFRPMLANLADLLPDSPCNDPIELVPELTPLAPLQDLNDISSILDADYMSSVCSQPLTTLDDQQNASMQEALDFVSEQENELLNFVIANANSKAHISRIENIGYSKSSEDNTIKFYCLSDNCSFIYSDECIGLETHLMQEHPHTSWKGYCDTCKAQVENSSGMLTGLRLSAEIKHMQEKHTWDHQQVTGQAVAAKDVPEEDVAESQMNKKPRLKIRRFSGDCLSSTSENISTIEAINPDGAQDTRSQGFQETLPFNNNDNAPRIASVTPCASGSVCSLQIASVVSLNKETSKAKGGLDKVENSIQIPKIANVCSLNVAEWENDNESSTSQNHSLASARVPEPPVPNVDNDSEDLQVVAETVPVAQATTGEYVITQTISAQYEDGNTSTQLGFNISIASNPTTPNAVSDKTTSQSTTPKHFLFKCMSNSCKYQTYLSAAMRDHLRFHEQQEFANTREYLRCSRCSHAAESIEAYFEHAQESHLHPNTVLPRSEDVINSNKMTESEKYQSYIEQLQKTIDEITKTTGIPESKLYRCTIKGCKTALSEANYYSHIIYHVTTLHNVNVNNIIYKCPHCGSTYQRPNKIKTHIKSHGQHRYFCYLCMDTAISVEHILKHFEEKHWSAKNMYSIPLIKSNDNVNESSATKCYVSYSQKLNGAEVKEFGEKLIVEWRRKKEGSRTHFKPNEISLLPLTPIFQKELNCAICAYKTKVRTNLQRHLQLHNEDGGGSGQTVASVDPVNPVPCLNTNERHFDKMTNLASSSVVISSNNATAGGSSGGSGAANNCKIIYEYVAETKRFTCGVTGCQYLTISDEIFRSHLTALHGDISNYNCPLCKEEICKRTISVERIMQHLRFHGPKLYQCEECQYVHYMKNVVERHIHEKHPAMNVNLIIHDRTNGEKTTKELITAKSTNVPADMTAQHKGDGTNSKLRSKWMCNICGYKAMTQQQMTAHCSAQHGCKYPYQCTHCKIGASQLAQVMSHIEEKHSGAIREVRNVFHKITHQGDLENKNDTRPLWQRDDPTRIRHIRGILMEDEEEESERNHKRKRLDSSAKLKDTLNELNESPSSAFGSISIVDSYEFGCVYCNSKYSSLSDLRELHWKSVHAVSPNRSSPFKYVLMKAVKCSECRSFSGPWFELEEHLKSVHNTKRFIAVDANSSGNGLVCGYCNFSCQTTDQLAKHNRRMAHKPFDIKNLTNEHLNAILKQGIKETYVQCNLCSEICANRSAILTHANDAHNGEDGFCFRELTNTIIYCCAKCNFTSTQEMSTLRHMIDHYDGFKRCHFCHEPQTTFNGYMQHCYSDHREAIKQFSEFYPFTQIKQYLFQMQLLFPNGLIINLHNLRNTAHDGTARVKQLYIEVCKTSQQPPIPRLSIARLVASKSIDEKKTCQSSASSNFEQGETSRTSASVSTAAAMQLAGNGGKMCAPFAAQKILKRRSTVALGRDESIDMNYAHRDNCSGSLLNNKKRKVEASKLMFRPPVPKTFEKSPQIDESDGTNIAGDAEVPQCQELKPFSFYGQPVDAMDLSKVYTRISISGVDSRVSVKKFKMLCKIDTRVIVENVNASEKDDLAMQANEDKYRHVKKACPASHKYKYA